MSVRPARADDIDGLLAFDMTVVVRSATDWARALDQCELGLRQLLVAVVDGVVAGFGQAHYLEAHADGGPAGYYLTGVTVLPDFRRQGLALELTVPRLEWIRDRADAAWCFINAQNDASIRLHEKLGFIEMHRASSIQGVVFGGKGGVLLERRLGNAGARSEVLWRVE